MIAPYPMADTIAIALGANLGDPAATLAAVRPLLAELVQPARCRWSPLFRTEPVGGPADQPPYCNAVLLLGPPLPHLEPHALLRQLQTLETRFGRQRLVHWGPRSLDLDLLWWGDLVCDDAALQLPHPRLLERSFVLAPLAAIDAELVPPGQPSGGPPLTCQALLEQLLPQLDEAPPLALPGSDDWPA